MAVTGTVGNLDGALTVNTEFLALTGTVSAVNAIYANAQALIAANATLQTTEADKGGIDITVATDKAGSVTHTGSVTIKD